MAETIVKIADALAGVRRLFLDTAPLIYEIERNPQYFAIVDAIFRRIDQGSIVGVTSPVTLAETLVVPYRLNSASLQRMYDDQVVRGRNTAFVTIDDYVARQAANIRARHNLRLADALQAAVAIRAGCDAFLTNDSTFQRVPELRVLLVDEIEI